MKITPQLPVSGISTPKTPATTVNVETATPAPPGDTALFSATVETPKVAVVAQTAPPPAAETPRPVAFTPLADVSVEAFEQANAKLATLEGGYTKAHMTGTAQLAQGLAEAVGLSARETRDLLEASHVYDAGKLTVSEEVWNDARGPRDMPKEEWGAMWQQMCRHVEISTERSRSLGKSSDAAVEATMGALNSKVASGDDGVRSIIRHHHEKLDGTGYPDRLKGNEIPKGAQILGICDMYEALRSPRSFRPAKDYASTRAILEGDAQNGKLNPEMVRVFFEKVVSEGS